MGRRDFSSFIFTCLQALYGEHLRPYEGLAEHAFIRDLPEPGDCEAYSEFVGVYLVQDVPFELFHEPRDIDFKTPYLMKMLARIREDYSEKFFLYGPQMVPTNELNTIYFLNNLRGFSLDFYRDVLLPKYEAITTEAGLYLEGGDVGGVLVGSADSFVEQMPDPTLRILDDFLRTNRHGLSIELTHGPPAVRDFSSEKPLSAGVARVSNAPCAPVYGAQPESRDPVIKEFEDLLAGNPKEDVLEKFLTKHYRRIFGPKYDRIETQIWLRFPKLDINAKNRRLDLFLRNAVSGDWELYELKRIVPVTSNYRGIR